MQVVDRLRHDGKPRVAGVAVLVAGSLSPSWIASANFPERWISLTWSSP